MDEGPPKRISPEQQSLNEFDSASELIDGLYYFLSETGKNNDEIDKLMELSQRIHFETFWSTKEEVGKKKKIVEATKKIKKIFDAMKDLAIKAGVSPAEITPKKLKSYRKMLDLEDSEKEPGTN